MRTYQFDKKGSEIQELLDQIKNKTIYGNATTEAAGLMSAEDKKTLDTLVDNVGENIQQLNELNNTVAENSSAIETNTSNIATNTSSINALNTATGNLGTRLDAAEETLDNIFQLDANNFMGIYASDQVLPTPMTEAGWALVGDDLTALLAYVWNIPQGGWQQYGNTTYDYSDYSGLVTQVATIGSKLDDLRDELLGGVIHSYDYTSSYFTVNVLYPYVAVGSTVASRTTTSGSGSYVIPIKYGDTLNILARNSSGANNYPFFIVDENYTALYVGQNGTVTPVERVVNVTYENAAYVIVNNAKTPEYPNSWSYVTVTSPEGGRVIDLEEDVAKNTTDIGNNAAEIERIKDVIEIPSSSTYLFDACVNGSYINCATVGSAYSINSDVLNGYLILPCTSGDVFTVSTYGGNSSRAYAFADENNLVISRSASYYTANEETITAPSGATQLIVNLRWETATRLEKQNYFKVVAYSSEYIDAIVQNLEERVTALEGLDIYEHEEVTETFTVKVNGNKPFSPSQMSSTISPNEYIAEEIYDHTCYFKAPSGSEPCKLVISCPGGGIAANSWYSYMNHGAILNALGYAVLCITGYSDAYYNDRGVTSYHAPIGSWMATEEAKKAYKYLIEKYAWIDRNGVFLYGESQGGMVAENIAEESGIPIRATVLDAPAISMQYAQMYLSTRAACINVLYGLSNHNFNKAACVGCDPFTRNMSEDIVMDESGTLPTIASLSGVVARKFRSCGTPIMILSGEDDTTISPDVHKCYAQALMNANAPIQFLLYSGVGHGVIQYSASIGNVASLSCTSGLAKLLEFYKRCGGYDYTISITQ